MIKALMLTIAFATSFAGYAQQERQKPQGFLWYNMPEQEVTKKEIQSKVLLKNLSPTMQRDVLVYKTREALAKFDVKPTKENALEYIKWQNFWMKQTTLGKRAFQEAMLQNPEHNYSATHPTSSLGLKLAEVVKIKKSAKIIHDLAKDSGLIFFYRGSNAYDAKEASIIKSFGERFKISILPVSVDGVISESLPGSNIDQGQAQKLNIKYYPAIMLYNSKTKEVKPVSYGFVTQDVIANNLLMVATNFKGDGL